MIQTINQWLTRGNRIERIYLLAKYEFKLSYYGTKLGLVWAMIGPLQRVFMYYLVFQVLMDSQIENFVVYLLSGLIFWVFFTDCTSRSINILKRQKTLYENTQMDKMEIYVSRHLSATIGLGLNFLVFIIFCFFSEIYPNWQYIWLIPIYINILILAFGFSLILSNLFLIFQDIQNIWNIVVMFGFFLSPILYRGKVIEQKLPLLIYFNPISGIIINLRKVLLYNARPDLKLLAFDFLYAFLILSIGLFLYKRIAKYASELA